MTKHSCTLNYFRADADRVCLAKDFSSLHNRKRHDDGKDFSADVQKEDQHIAERLQTLDELPEIPLMFPQGTRPKVCQKMNPSARPPLLLSSRHCVVCLHLRKAGQASTMKSRFVRTLLNVGHPLPNWGNTPNDGPRFCVFFITNLRIWDILLWVEKGFNVFTVGRKSHNSLHLDETEGWIDIL